MMAFWHRLLAVVRPQPKPTPFMREMRDARAEALTATRESLAAQRRDRARRRDNPIEQQVLGLPDRREPPCAD